LRQAAGDAAPRQEPPDDARHRTRERGNQHHHPEESEEGADGYNLDASRKLCGVDLEAEPERADTGNRDQQSDRGTAP
jgi:hypothetical protein